MLYSLGMTQEDICREYYNTVTYVKSNNNNWSCFIFPERFRGVKPTFDVIDADTGEIIAPADKKVTPRLVKKLLEQKKSINILVPFENLIGRYVAVDIINEETGEIWIEAGEELTWEIDEKTGNVTGGSLLKLMNNGINEIPTLT